MKTMNYLKELTLIFMSLATFNIYAAENELTQTVRGKVIDVDSKTPLVGATIILIGSDPLVGTITDIDGSFTLENVFVGRVDLKVSSMGYEDKVISKCTCWQWA